MVIGKMINFRVKDYLNFGNINQKYSYNKTIDY